MKDLPKRKNIRIEDYDYSAPGAYFITVCTANREKIFWKGVGADIIRPRIVPLSSASNPTLTDLPKHLHKKGDVI